MQLAENKSKKQKNGQPEVMKMCQVCQEEANYICSDCKYSAYCSRQHQIQHWRTHKDSCKVLEKYNQVQKQNALQEKRYTLRKLYVESFSNKVYDQALRTAQELVKMEENNVKITRIITNQLQYGAAVCLLCKTLVILKRDGEASIQMKKYLDQKKHFLQDLRDIPQIPTNSKMNYNLKKEKEGTRQIDKKDSLSERNTDKNIIGKQAQNLSQLSQISNNTKDFLDKKLCLIAGIANILNLLKIDCMDYYEIYTTHVQKFFGQNSQELSNCFFMIGCYFKQKNQINKSIACFIKAASMRTSKAGDCYLNIGILVKIQGKLNAALQFLEIAIMLKQQELGENCTQVAEIRQCLARIYSENKNFSAAMRQLEKALKIRSNNMINQKEGVIKRQIRQLYDNIKKHLQSGSIQDMPLKPEFYNDLKITLNSKLKMAGKGQTEQVKDQSFKSEDKRLDLEGLGKLTKFSGTEEKLLKMSQNFLMKLSKGETLRLSQLQLQLQKCRSDYAMAYAVGRSDFIKSLFANNNKLFNQIKHENQKLFQLINLQEIMMAPKEKSTNQ